MKLKLDEHELSCIVLAMRDVIDQGICAVPECWPSASDVRVAERLQKRCFAALCRELGVSMEVVLQNIEAAITEQRGRCALDGEEAESARHLAGQVAGRVLNS